MTTEQGAVYDLGYEPYHGKRLGRKGATRTVWADGNRRVLGIRRKARRKIMPWLLVAMALVPAIVFVGIAFILPSGVANDFDLAEANSNFFQIGGTIAMLFTALAAPELLIPDRRDGVLSMLSSRPLTSNDYLAARFASNITVVAGFLLIPQLLILIGQAGTDPDGLIQGIINAAPTIPKILAVTAVYVIAYVPIGFMISSLVSRKSIAASVFLAMIIGLTAFSEAIVRNSVIPGGRWVALLAPINTADSANVWIFGSTNNDSLLAVADIHPLMGIAALLVIGTLAVLVSVRRYRELM
jgi:ABC-2 type transport system permease protein